MGELLFKRHVEAFSTRTCERVSILLLTHIVPNRRDTWTKVCLIAVSEMNGTNKEEDGETGTAEAACYSRKAPVNWK